MAEFGYPLNGVEYTAEQAGAYFACRTSGVFPGENNLAVRISDAENRQLTLSPGLAWFNTESTWGKVYCNTDDITLQLPTAHGTLESIIRIIIRWDRNANAFSAQLLAGTPAATPVAPSISRTDDVYDLVVADYRIAAAEATASEARLIDRRADEEVCGYTSDGVVRIPTSTLYAQFQSWIDLLEEAYDAAIAGVVVPHHTTHSMGGTDAIAPADIGAASVIDGKVAPEEASASILTVTGGKTLALSDAGTFQKISSSSAVTLTVPTNAGAEFPVGTEIEFCRYGSGTVTFSAASGVTIVSANSLTKIADRYGCAGLKKLDTDVWLLAGDLG